MPLDFLFELGDFNVSGIAAAWPAVAAGVLLGAPLGAWCVGFASRYGRLLLAIFNPGDGIAAPDLPQDCQSLIGASGLWRSVSRGRARQNQLPVLIQCCAAALMALCVSVFGYRHGISPVFAGLVAASAIMLVLALVDAATMLLPDTLTFPLLWLGLACAWVRGPAFLQDSVAGVMAGYCFLWLLFWLYWHIRNRQGMGQGDFKLLAAQGAWVGLERLPYVLLAACLLGVLFACLRQKNLNLSASYPFGPFLAISGMGVLLAGPEVHFYFWQ